MYFYLPYDYDDDYGNDIEINIDITSTTVTCNGNELSPFELDCQEGNYHYVISDSL